MRIASPRVRYCCLIDSDIERVGPWGAGPLKSESNQRKESMSKINVVIEVQDATAFSVHPVVGRSGRTYGMAVYCGRRGCMALRMSVEDWRQAREDICTARHRFYPFVIDFEEEEPVGVKVDVAKAPKKKPVKVKPTADKAKRSVRK